MKAFIALGSNLGEPLKNLEAAGSRLAVLGSGLRVSPVVRTPAHVPEGAPASWRLPFLNALAELEWSGSPRELLAALKTIERELGRGPSARWAPRLIDLDILALGDLQVAEDGLTLPHPEAWRRGFVLGPWKELAPSFRLPGQGRSVLELFRQVEEKRPLWMGILNLTPDSFSDGGQLLEHGALAAKLERWEHSFVHALDLGGESTRPGAASVSPGEEWARVGPVLELLRERYRGRIFRPLVSVDTRHPATAEKALEAGADILNDVSGGEDPAMLAIAKHAPAGFVAMHSLTVPADPKVTMPESTDPVRELRLWAGRKLEVLERAGVSGHKVILDPGIGFGKTAAQSLELVRRISELTQPLGCGEARWLIGHSRKSFLQAVGPRTPAERDGFSVGASLCLAAGGADWLRVHDPALHADAHAAWEELK